MAVAVGVPGGRTFPAFPSLWYRYGTKETKKTHRSHLTTSKGSGINLSSHFTVQYRNRNNLESTQTTWVPPQGGTPQGTGGVVPDTMHGSKAIISRPGIPHSTLRGVLRIFGARGIYFLWSLFFPSPDDSHHKSKSQYYLVYAQSSWLFQKSYE